MLGRKPIAPKQTEDQILTLTNRNKIKYEGKESHTSPNQLNHIK